MDPARPLRDVFADLVGDESARQAHAADPEGFLLAAGHLELPDSLVSEAIVSYADTAPAEVAEHLAPFVMAHSAVPVEDGLSLDELDATHGLDLLSTAPAEPALDEDPALDVHPGADPAGPVGDHAIAGPDLGGHDLADHDLADHDGTGHDLADHDGTGPDLGGHDLAGHDLADHDGTGPDLGGHDFADPFGLDFGHGDSGEPVPAGHLDPADLGTGGPDHLPPVEPDGTDAGPDWLGDLGHPDPVGHLDSPADLDQPDHLPDQLPDAAGTGDHGPDDVADL